MKKQYFDQIIIMGAGTPAFECAKLLHSYADFSFWDTSPVTHSFIFEKVKKICAAVHTFAFPLLADLLSAKHKVLILSVNNEVLYPVALVNNPNVTIINYHNSLLPLHRGLYSEAWAIFQEDSTSGITWHMVDAAVDTGAIVCQNEITLKPDISSVRLLQEQAALAIAELQKILPDILQNHIPTRPQPLIAFEQRHYRHERPNDGILLPDWPVHTMWAFLRAMDYGPFETLGKPRVCIDTRWKHWKNYRLLDALNKKQQHCQNSLVLHNAIVLEGLFDAL